MRTSAGGVVSRWILTACAIVSWACAPAAPTPAAPAPSAKLAASASSPARVEPPEGPVASLRTGELLPIDHRDPARATLVARAVDERYETLALELALPLSAAFDFSERVGCRVSIDQEGAKPYAFAAMPDDVSAIEGRGLGAATIWMRRPRDQEGQPATGIVFTPQLGGEPGHKVRFRAATDVKLKSDPRVIGRWAAAFGKHLREIGAGPWFEFAARRVEEVFGTKKKGAAAAPRPARNTEELVRLMETTTGLLAVQEALQHDRPLLLAASKEKRAVPVGKLVPPAAAAHPWDELLRGAKVAPAEPLADAVPAEFWYVRAADIPKLFLMADQLDAWGTPAANLFDRSLHERDLQQRYETQLGLLRTSLGRIVGPEMLSSVALAGSDPYLREGSDVTALFKVRNAALFNAALEGMLATHAQAHGGTTKTTVAHRAARIDVATSPDGAIRQHRATVNDLEIVSNSLAAVKIVLDTIDGKRDRLSNEKDFRYMLARDAGDPPVLGFYGDRFVAAAVGAKQKVLEARRQMAAAELMTPGFASLLYGWVHGRAPSSVDELLASKLLSKDELKHANGAPIEWTLGQPARSTWGTPSSLTPLLDLPEPDLVSESERAAYDRFSRTYETYWSRYIDPATLRLDLSGPDPGVVSAELRVLPLIDGTDYREIIELAGQARVSVSPIVDGLRTVVGIGPTARVRRELSGLARGMSGRHGLAFDFLGDWAMVGVADRPRLAEISKKLRLEFPQAPEAEPTERIDEIAEAARIPAYAAVEIRSKSGAALALAAVRKMADEALHGTLSWGDVGTEHGTTLFRVAVGQRDEGGGDPRKDNPPELSIFYALTDKAFLASLDEGVLRRVVTDVVEGRGPAAPTGKVSADASQLVVDLAGKREGGLLTVAGWLLSAQLVRASTSSKLQAETLLRGAPDRANDAATLRALSLAYFGAVPTPPFGGTYTLAADGVHDPSLGSANSPRWPRLPVEGSSVDKLFAAVGRLRSEIAFDSEGAEAKNGRGMQSLHVRAAIGLREH